MRTREVDTDVKVFGSDDNRLGLSMGSSGKHRGDGNNGDTGDELNENRFSGVSDSFCVNGDNVNDDMKPCGDHSNRLCIYEDRSSLIGDLDVDLRGEDNSIIDINVESCSGE
jgi:hypothetical protein